MKKQLSGIEESTKSIRKALTQSHPPQSSPLRRVKEMEEGQDKEGINEERWCSALQFSLRDRSTESLSLSTLLFYFNKCDNVTPPSNLTYNSHLWRPCCFPPPQCSRMRVCLCVPKWMQIKRVICMRSVCRRSSGLLEASPSHLHIHLSNVYVTNQHLARHQPMTPDQSISGETMA